MKDGSIFFHGSGLNSAASTPSGMTWIDFPGIMVASLDLKPLFATTRAVALEKEAAA
ncbi:MAG: hypothetical protein WC551_12740 [Patescibacteria group bacterium]